MDFLSKINANAGIDVKKDFVAENATVTNFEVSDSANTSLSTTISPSVATFNNSNFYVSAIGGIYIANNDTDAVPVAEMTMYNGSIGMITSGGGHGAIYMVSDSLIFCGASIDIQYDFGRGIRILDDNTGEEGKLQFNSEFFKLQYSTPPQFCIYGGPAFEITSIMANSNNNVQEALPTAEIKSQRLDISAYSKNDNNIPANITLHVTPAEFVDDTTKEPINNDHDSILKVDESGIHLYTGCSQNDASRRVEVSSYASDINSASYINLEAGIPTTDHASIRISSPLDDLNTTGTSKVEISTSEFLVESGGIKFLSIGSFDNHVIETDDTTLRFIAPDSRFDDTNSVTISFKDNGGCMTFTRDGINVSTTPEGSTSAISGNALLSQSLRSIERMTQSEYDAIETKDENTLYIIAG